MCSSSPSRASSSRSPLVLAIAYLSSESAVFHSRGNICSCPRSSRSRPLPPCDRAPSTLGRWRRPRAAEPPARGRAAARASLRGARIAEVREGGDAVARAVPDRRLAKASALCGARHRLCKARAARSLTNPRATCGSRSASSRRRVELGRSHTTQPSSVRSSMGREPAPTIPHYRRAGSLLGRAAEAKGDSSSPLTSLRFEGTMQERTGPWRPPGSFTASPTRGSRRRVSRRPRSTQAKSNRPESLPRVRVVVHAAACLRFELVKKCWHGGNRVTEDGRDRGSRSRPTPRLSAPKAPERF